MWELEYLQDSIGSKIQLFSMILHPTSTAEANSGAAVNPVLLNPQPNAFAGLTLEEIKKKVTQPMADNLTENYKVSDKTRW